jgi:hypothetical protein
MTMTMTIMMMMMISLLANLLLAHGEDAPVGEL